MSEQAARAVAPNLPIFRLGVVGRRAAGKTCYLTSLVMARLPHPRQLSATWVPDPSKATGAAAGWSIFEARAAGWSAAEWQEIERGRDWLRGARQALENGKLPPPNPVAEGRLRFLILVSSPESRAYVEIVDYSGEFLDEGTTKDTRAQLLYEYLATSDGLLILAEMVRPDQGAAVIAKELSLVQEAFAQLMQQRVGKADLGTPIAVLVNKWDRVSTIAASDPEGEDAKLKAMLTGSQQPMHAGLVTSITNYVGSANVGVFPVSAFGQSKRLEVAGAGYTDMPAVAVPLPAFNVIEPLIWLVERRQTLVVADLEQAVRQRKPWKLWQVATGGKLSRKLRSARHLTTGCKALAARVATGQRQSAGSAMGLGLAIASLATLTPPVAMTVVDEMRWRELEQLNVEQASRARLQSEIDWLDNVVTDTPYLRAGTRLLHDQKAIHQIRARAHASLERQTFLDVLSTYDAGLQAWIEGAEKLMRRPDITSAEIEAARDRLKAVRKVPALLERQGVLAATDTQLSASLGIRKVAMELDNKLGAREVEAVRDETLAAANGMLIGGDVVQAAESISRLVDEDVVRTWRADFAQRAAKGIVDRVGNLLDRSEWGPAQAYLEAVRTSAALRQVAGTQSASLIDAVGGQTLRIKLDRDRKTYEELRRTYARWQPGQSTDTLRTRADAYLELEDPKMAGAVRAMRRFLVSLEKPVKVRLLVENIYVTNPCKSNFYSVLRHRITVQFASKIFDNVLPIPIEPATTKINETIDPELLVAGTHTLSATVVRTSGSTLVVASCPTQGAGSMSVSLADLMKGRTLSLTGELQADLSVRAELVERQPPLDAWTSATDVR